MTALHFTSGCDLTEHENPFFSTLSCYEPLALRCIIYSCARKAWHAVFPDKGVFMRVCLQIQNDNPDANGKKKHSEKERTVIRTKWIMRNTFVFQFKGKRNVWCILLRAAQY